MKIKTLLLILMLLGSFATYSANLVSWSSPEGIKRFSETKINKDFFKLANFFQGQSDGLICGPTTGAIIMNAFKIRNDESSMPKTHVDQSLRSNLPKNYDPRLKKYTPRSFINTRASRIKSWEEIYGKPLKGKKDFGLQLRQLHKIFETHGIKSSMYIVNKSLKLEKMRSQFIENLKNTSDFIVVNYARKSLGQKGGGHISPIGAYHKQSDSFLVMDVNPNKDNWVWVTAKDLYESMNTFDTIENRGYLLLKQ